MSNEALVCPRCRSAALPGHRRRCPNDGAFYVAQAALLKAGRDAMLGAFVAERYAVVELLGIGGMGAVYRAIDDTTQTSVAIKFLRDEYAHHAGLRKRFIREAEAGACIDSPHVVPLLDFGVDDSDALYIVMAFVKGWTLRDEINRRGPLAVREGLELSRQLLLGLAAAHEVGVIHRDLKHDNVMWFGPRGRFVARILDFGVVKFAPTGAGKFTSGEHERLTHAGALVGSPSYMSPEQVRGLEVGPPADLYSMAVVVYEALTARPLFPAASYEALLREGAQRDVPTLSHTADGEPVPPDFDRIMQRALRRDPDDRYPDARTMLMAIEQIEGSGQASWPSELFSDAPPGDPGREAPKALTSGLISDPVGAEVPAAPRIESDRRALSRLFDTPPPGALSAPEASEAARWWPPIAVLIGGLLGWSLVSLLQLL